MMSAATAEIEVEVENPIPANSDEQRLKALVRHCQAYKGAETARSLFQLVTTLGLYVGLVAAMLYAYHREAYWFVALGMLPAAGLLVRLFIIQHDCGHRSFFNQAWANTLVGQLISILTFTPYDFWRRAHNMHHASSGNLSKRCAGSIDTLTVREYNELPAREKLLYRMFRHPLVVLLIGAPVHVFIMQRLLPVQSVPFLQDFHPMPVAQSWRSIMGLNVAIVVLYGLMGHFVGWGAFFLAYLPIVAITAWAGGWLFFVQHQFENTYWKPENEWNYYAAALYGSSYYVLPKWLQWFTGNIGLHHIHHFCALIPNYKLQACLDANADLQQMNRLTFWSSLKCVRWALWDETKGKMVAFRDLTQPASA